MVHDCCPISNGTVDENVVRLRALMVLAVGIIFWITGQLYLMVFLVLDFTAVAFKLPKFSVLSASASIIIKILNVSPKMTNAGPKIFAAKFGLVCISMILGFSLLRCSFTSKIFLSILSICAFLESFFNYCSGCRLFSLIHLLKGGNDYGYSREL